MVETSIGRHRDRMTTLHISHTVRDFDEWLTTFNSFSEFRAQGGVTGLTVRHAADDPNFVAVDLEFESVEQARSFLGRLETEIWPNAPHIDGTPATRVMNTVRAA